jgi:2-succinyl-6-hydroxy-2,4-cyclohexadiene-1-carboxylate synthase
LGVIRTISGFLGLPEDWDFLPWPHVAYDGPIDPDDVLLGYSMGGRRALQVLEQVPVAKAVIVSAGINAPDALRRERDEVWARRFETDSWEALMHDWNAQAVFGGHSVERRELDYDRSVLARQLREWSPAVLPPPRLERIETPLLWVAGALDAKYVEIGKAAVARLARAELWVCPGAGHRVPWEQPQAFVERLREFLELQ